MLARRAPLLAAAAALVVHLPALGNRYALDDAAILANPAIASWRALPGALAAPWWYETRRLYRPLTLLTLGVDHVMRAPPWASHGANVLLHALVAALVVRLCMRFLPTGGALVAGLSVALLPVHAEAVATIVGRAELLCALATAAAMLVVTRATPPSPRARLALALLAGAALAAKESGAAAPLLVFAAAHAVPRQRPHARTWATSALLGTLALLAARAAVLGTLGGDQPHPFFRGMPGLERIGVAVMLLPRTAAMLFLPVPPSIEEVPALAAALHPDPLALLGGAALLAGAVALAMRHVRRPSAITLGAVVLVATIAPTSNLLFAEGALTARTLYAPSIGAAMIAGGLAAALSRTRWRAALPCALAAGCVPAAVLSWREARVWRDTPSVLATMVERRPDSYRGHELLAYAARDAGRLDESERRFGAAIVLFPGDAELLTDAATVALRVHDTTTATRWLGKAIEASPRAARARTRLYGIVLARGDTARARALLEEGLRQEPEQRSWSALLASGAAARDGDRSSADARAGTRTRTP